MAWLFVTAFDEACNRGCDRPWAFECGKMCLARNVIWLEPRVFRGKGALKVTVVFGKRLGIDVEDGRLVCERSHAVERTAPFPIAAFYLATGPHPHFTREPGHLGLNVIDHVRVVG